MILAALAFGVPYPAIDDSPPTTSDAPITDMPVELQTTGSPATEDADALLPAIAAGGVIGGAAVGGFVAGYWSSSWTEASTETESAAYYGIQNQRAEIKSDLTGIQNSEPATKTMAYSVAEANFAEAMAAGKSKSVAQSEAEQAVSDYLASIQINEFAWRQNQITSSAATWQLMSGVSLYQNAPGTPSPTNPTQYTVNLVNGSTTDIEAFHDDSGDMYTVIPPSSIAAYSGNHANDEVFATFDDPDLNDEKVLDTSDLKDYATEWDDIELIRDEVVSEISKFAGNISASQYDNLSASDVVSPITEARKYSEKWRDTGNAGYAAGLAGNLGYALNQTGTLYDINITGGGTINGTLYADPGALNGTVESGKTYNTSGDLAYVVDKETGEERTLDSEFTIREITSEDGSKLDSADFTQKFDRRTLDPNEPLKRQTAYEKLRANLSLSDALLGGGGGLFGDNPPLGIPWIGWIIGVIAVLLIATRE